MQPSHGRRRRLWRLTVSALAAAVAAATGARVAADDCPALLNLTSFYPRTLLLVVRYFTGTTRADVQESVGALG